MSSAPASATPRVPSVVSFFNPLIRRLIGRGMPFGPNVLLTVRGRTSGVDRTFPVAIIEQDGRRFVQSPFGEVNWVRNLRASGRAVISKGPDRTRVEAIEIAPEAAGPIMRDYLAPYLRPRIGRAIVRRYFHARAEATVEDYVTRARSYPMFELRTGSEGEGSD